jgi:hypothetical protein
MMQSELPLIDPLPVDDRLAAECRAKWGDMAWRTGEGPNNRAQQAVFQASRGLHHALGQYAGPWYHPKAIWNSTPAFAGKLLARFHHDPDGWRDRHFAISMESIFRLRRWVARTTGHRVGTPPTDRNAADLHFETVQKLRILSDRITCDFRAMERSWLEQDPEPENREWLPEGPWDLILTQFNCDWLAGADWLARIGRLPAESGLGRILTIMEHSALCVPMPTTTVVCRRPAAIHRDSEGQVHSMDGPAVDWRGLDDWFYFRGNPVPANTIEALRNPPPDISARIRTRTDGKLRRDLIAWRGEGRFVTEAGESVATDDYGTLYRVGLPGQREGMAIVKVLNATPEPDGSFKDYCLRVPPWVESPRQAVAWTFGLGQEEDYDPVHQT